MNEVEKQHDAMKRIDAVLAATQQLSERLVPFREALPGAKLKAVAAIDPTIYAYGNYARFMHRAAAGPRRCALVGMNPGPHGMAQTGVPFGDVPNARVLLDDIDAITDRPFLRGTLGETWDCKGLEYHRGEQSGQRVWSALSQLFGSPQQACEHVVIINYCPLFMVGPDLKNRTPSELARRSSLTTALEAACDDHLRRIVQVLDVEAVLTFGDYAHESADRALTGFRLTIEKAPHPSPQRYPSASAWAADALPAIARATGQTQLVASRAL